MKIGFLLCAYNQEEFVNDCLNDLVEFSTDNDYPISAVSVPFAEYKGLDIKVDNTTKILQNKLGSGDIDFLVDSPDYMTEAEARTAALKPLLKECDWIFLIDSDEIYTYEQLNNIVNFVEQSEFITWFSIALKNYVGDGHLEEPFFPPRIFKTEADGLELNSFYYDNDVLYFSPIERVNYKKMSNKAIPKEVAFVKHLSWTNTEKNRQKINYQEKHFAPTGCSYKWDEEKGIIFNDEYFKSTNQVKPKIIYE